jgi:hypothetical protein
MKIPFFRVNRWSIQYDKVKQKYVYHVNGVRITGNMFRKLVGFRR